MRIQLLSDPHLESAPDFTLQLADGVDVLVLAGDIGSYQPGSRLPDGDFGLGRFAPQRLGERPPVVVYVPGNHEYDQLDFDATHARLRSLCQALGIVWLERETLVLEGVRFIGSTLWSDFDALAQHDRKGRPLDEKARLTQRDKAFRAANFYLRKYSSLRDGEPMLADRMRELALACQAWLREALAVPFDGRTVVVTHFAPSLRSADPRYGLVPGTAGFCNALDELLPAADLWLHGHLHCRVDYEVASGPPPRTCRVVANPLGYADKGEQAGFQPALAIDLPAALSSA